MNQKTLIILLSGFLSGVLIRSFLDFGVAFALFFIFVGTIFLVLYFLAPPDVITKRRVSAFLFVSLFLISAGLGMMRYELKEEKQSFVFNEKSFEGIIVEEPDERENNTRLVVENNGARILIYATQYPEFHYGDKIKIMGKIKKSENFSSDFSWVDYLAKDDIYYEMIYPKIDFISAGNGSRLKSALFSVKEKFMNNLAKVLPEPHASFLAGLTIGAKKSIPKSLQEDFKKTGVSHIVVLSGYNITIVADFVTRLFSFLPGIASSLLGGLAILLFAIMTGGSATVVRASIMALLVILARATGRMYQITWALFLAAFFMILQNPKILRFDVSFQLSFLATLALIWLAPILEKLFKLTPIKNPPSPSFSKGGESDSPFAKGSWRDLKNLRRGILVILKQTLATTLAAQIFVLPLLLYKMGLFSVVALPANLLILPFIPATMFLGFAVGIIGMFSSILAIPLGWISFAFLQYELSIVNFFANLLFASFAVPHFPLWAMWGMYALIAVLIYKFTPVRYPTSGE